MVSESIIIYGSDLVHNEGRKFGNYLSVFLHCQNFGQRAALIAKLKPAVADPDIMDGEEGQLIEITDAFDVSWVLRV